MSRTVREIATAAGVSPATVSRVVNGSGGVAPEKRERILAELERTGGPRRSRSTRPRGETIGMLLLPGSEGDPRVIVNKLAALAERLPHRWNLQLLPAGILPLELESRHLHGELAGLILAGHGGGSPELAGALARIPHIWLNSHRLREGGQTVLMGNEFAGRIAARYLIDSCCRNAAVLTAPSINPGFASRIEGFRFEFFARELECGRIELHPPRGFELCTPAELEPLLLEKFSALNPFPDGLFSPEERLTALLHRTLCRLRPAHWPRIISCNYTPEYLAGLYPRPASIDLGARMLAELALEELRRRISGAAGRADNVAVIATPELIPGDEPLPETGKNRYEN